MPLLNDTPESTSVSEWDDADCVRAGRPPAFRFHGQIGSIGTTTLNESEGAAHVRFHGLPALNNRYRERVALIRGEKVKKP